MYGARAKPGVGFNAVFVDRLMTHHVRDNPFRSVLGRRMLLLFALSALIPIALLTILVYSQVTAMLKTARDFDLAQASASASVEIADRLRAIDEALRTAQTEQPAREPAKHWLAARVGTELTGFALYDASDAAVKHAGRVPPLRLTTQDRQTLAEGRTVIVITDVTRQVVLLRPVDGQERNGAFLAAALSPKYLWGDALSLPPPAELCVFTAALSTLECPRAIAADDARRFVSSARVGRGAPIEWNDTKENFRSFSATVPIPGAAAKDGWVAVVTLPETIALRPARGLIDLLAPAAALAALLAMLLASRQISRILRPLQELLAGTRRVAAQDFSGKVEVAGHDEFVEVADAFNRMASSLSLHFDTLNSLARIDRALLASSDLDDVAKHAVRCIQRIAQVERVSIGLFLPDSPDRVRVYTRRDATEELIEREEFAWAFGEASTRLARPGEHWSAQPPLPSPWAEHLHRAAPDMQFLVLPIARSQRLWGVVVLGASAPCNVPKERRSLISRVIDRLAAALSTTARDWKLHMQAHFDALTGLPNRLHLTNMLADQIGQAKRDQSRGALLFLDLDRFKQTNDTLGHSVGDELLQRAAERIKLSLRASDTVARLGGDEFTIVLRQIGSPRDAGAVADQLIKVLSKAFEIGDHKLYAGASVGIAIFPDDGDTAPDLLKKADTAMYRAKDQGRGRYAFYTGTMDVELNERATLDRELRQALERNEFMLHYQPQVDAWTGKLVSVEALLRWQHPLRGVLGPSEFIEFCEESRLIEALGAWVLRHACEQLKRWDVEGIEIPRISVNVSNRQLQLTDFVGSVRGVLADTSVPAGRLEVEVTESLLLEGGTRAVSALRELEDAGVHVAIDDFGTGYSSLGYLRTLPASILKLDRSFIVDIVDSREARAITAAIISMSRTLRKDVVAEGVETVEQLATLRSMGCDRIQGFLISPALETNTLAVFARSHAHASLFSTPNEEAHAARRRALSVVTSIDVDDAPTTLPLGPEIALSTGTPASTAGIGGHG